MTITYYFLSVSPSPGSDVSMQTQLVRALCLFVISIGARDLELLFANKRVHHYQEMARRSIAAAAPSPPYFSPIRNVS